MKLIAVLVMAAAAWIGCQRSEDRYLQRQVQPTEVIGEWAMVPSSVTDLVAVGYSAPVDPLHHTIDIRADGTCRFRTFASAMSPSGIGNPAIDRQCRWTVRDVASRQALLIDLVGEPSLIVSYYFTEYDGRLLLWQHVDDPDSWRYVEYAKRGSTAPLSTRLPVAN